MTEFATSSLSICRLVDKVLSGRRPIRFLLVRYRHLALVGNTVCHLALEKTFLKTAYYARFQGKGAFCAILFCVVVGVVLFFFSFIIIFSFDDSHTSAEVVCGFHVSGRFPCLKLVVKVNSLSHGQICSFLFKFYARKTKECINGK